ncbi:MAG: hypothetical protein PF795_04980 [Kiritimatiellae bacterium]|jgi:hypothetical protein|nr:hypothetical protein [Kiritimatiellia bacterium]
MTNITTAETLSGRVMRVAWTIAIIVHVVVITVFIFNKDLRVETLTFDREEAGEKAQIVNERARRREKAELERREKTKLPEKDAESLREREERKREEEIQKRVEEIKESYEVIKEVERERFEMLEAQTLDRHRTSEGRLRDLRRMAEEVLESGEALMNAVVEAKHAEALHKQLDEHFMPSAKRARSRAHRVLNTRNRSNPEGRDELLEAAGVLNGEMKSVDEAIAGFGGAENPFEAKRVHVRMKVDAFVHEVERLFGEASEAYAKELAKTPEPINDAEMLKKAENLDRQTVDELYDTAVELEKKMAERYENTRAAELGALRKMDFEEAKDRLANLGEPKRPDLGKEIREKNINTVGDLNEHREPLDKALAETENMRARAQNRKKQVDPDGEKSRQMANRREGGGPQPKKDADGKKSLKEQARGRDIAAANLKHRQDLRNAVQQKDGRSVDLSGMMRALTQQGSSENPDGQGSSQQTGPKQLPDVELGEKTVVAKALPGRRFTEDAARQGWLYIDTWYVIGPWDLREYDDKALPPQTEIDLDAVYYNGKKGRPRHARTKKRMHLDGELRWRFHQSDKLFVRPPYETGNAIYFAYTELYFDQARDIVLAIGIDDESNVWVNGIRIWGHSLKSWNMGSALRKVHFKEGYNTILIRMDNGAPLMDFSLVLCPPGVLDALASQSEN